MRRNYDIDGDRLISPGDWRIPRLLCTDSQKHIDMAMHADRRVQYEVILALVAVHYNLQRIYRSASEVEVPA